MTNKNNGLYLAVAASIAGAAAWDLFLKEKVTAWMAARNTQNA